MDAARLTSSNMLTSVLTTPRVNKCSIKKNKKVESKIGFCTKYNKLDRTKISKCYHCKNIVDLNNEGLSQESLSNYGRLSETLALRISYVCNHCCSTLDLIKSLQERLESNTKSYDSISGFLDEKRDFLNSADETLKEIKHLGHKIECFNEKLGEIDASQDLKTKFLEERISDISEKLDVLDLRVSSQEQNLIPSDSDSTDVSPLDGENHRQYVRRKRVVFIGVPMGMSDMNFINGLSRLLKLDIDESKILKTFRIKARNVPPGKTRPLNVEFYNTKDKFAFLNALANNDRHSILENSEFNNVRCFQDRTYLQREKFKARKLEMETKNHQVEAWKLAEDRFERMRLRNNLPLTKINLLGEEEISD